MTSKSNGKAAENQKDFPALSMDKGKENEGSPMRSGYKFCKQKSEDAHSPLSSEATENQRIFEVVQEQPKTSEEIIDEWKKLQFQIKGLPHLSPEENNKLREPYLVKLGQLLEKLWLPAEKYKEDIKQNRVLIARMDKEFKELKSKSVLIEDVKKMINKYEWILCNCNAKEVKEYQNRKQVNYGDYNHNPEECQFEQLKQKLKSLKKQ